MADNFAVLYDRCSLPERQDGTELLELLAPKKGMKVLDLGCGTGHHANLFAQRVSPEGVVIAVDPDEERIKFAKEKYQGKGNRLQFLEGSSKNFPAGSYDIDIIFSNHVLNWIQDKGALFKKICESLSPGGCFAFVAVTDGESGSISMFLQQILGEERTRTILGGYSYEPQETYEELAVANGLEVTYATTSTHPAIRFENLHALLDYLEGIFQGRVTGLKLVDKDILEKFKEQHGEQPVMYQPSCCTLVLTKPK